MTPIPRQLLLVTALSMSAVTPASAQARPLEPADFVVAGIPDNYSGVDVEADMFRIRKILGAPASVRRHEFQPGEMFTTWQYEGLAVEFGSIARQGITITTPRIATRRGLRVGDSEQRVLALYGPPNERIDTDWIYEDPRERLHVISVTVRDGRVVQIYVGSLWD
jgi:hypothetical protein